MIFRYQSSSLVSKNFGGFSTRPNTTAGSIQDIRQSSLSDAILIIQDMIKKFQRSGQQCDTAHSYLGPIREKTISMRCPNIRIPNQKLCRDWHLASTITSVSHGMEDHCKPDPGAPHCFRLRSFLRLASCSQTRPWSQGINQSCNGLT